MATSPIYGWLEPDNTDLVKNGALAIRTLGNAIDTTMATMTPKSIVDAKGDLIAASANDTPARLAVGTNGQTIVADSTAATGLKYTNSAPLGGLNNLGSTLVSGSTTTITGLGGYSSINLLFFEISATAGATILIRFNSDTGNNYGFAAHTLTSGTTAGQEFSLAGGFIPLAVLNAAADNVSGSFQLTLGGFSNGTKMINGTTTTVGTSAKSYNLTGYYAGSQITSMSIITAAGTFDNGTLYVSGA